MKRIYLLFILNVWTGLIIAQTPITLGNSNMPGSGDTLRYTGFIVSTAGNYTQTGTNLNWNFSHVTSTTEGLRSFKSALQTPYFLMFFGFNEYGEKIADTLGAGPLTLTNYYNFYKKQSNPAAFIADGVGMTFSSVPIPSYYSDKDELYNFPMTYPKYDSTAFKFSTTTGGIIPINYTKVGYRVTIVDGWGTITTPYGTENCLRLITTQYATDSIKNTIIPFPLGFPNYQRSYQWLTIGSKIPYLEITGNLVGGNFTPTLSRYRGYKKEDQTGLNAQTAESQVRVYPNPVNNELRVYGNRITEEIYELYTLEGKKLASLTPAFYTGFVSINVSALEPGVYFIKTSGSQTENHLKFIKE